MEWAEFNINHRVRLVLTELGASIYNRQDRERRAMFWPNTTTTSRKEGDEVTMQMYEVMRLFGRFMGNGMPVPFQTNIRLDMESEFQKTERYRYEREHNAE